MRPTGFPFIPHLPHNMSKYKKTIEIVEDGKQYKIEMEEVSREEMTAQNRVEEILLGYLQKAEVAEITLLLHSEGLLAE